jgi:flagellar basal body-associated protein FliL
MSDKGEKAKSGDANAAESGAKKGPGKTVGIVAALMIAEAAGVYFIMQATGPKQAEATDVAIEGADVHVEESSVELPLMDDKFQNLQTGRVWVWDAEIVLKVKSKNESFVSEQLQSRGAEIKEAVSMIFRKAQHSHLKEPGLETLNRQLTAYVSEMLGKDSDGNERFERVVIPKCKGFPAE